jgi:hypothetical protein
MTLVVGGASSDHLYIDTTDLNRLGELGEEGWEIVGFARNVNESHITVLKSKKVAGE